MVMVVASNVQKGWVAASHHPCISSGVAVANRKHSFQAISEPMFVAQLICKPLNTAVLLPSRFVSL